MAKVSYDPEVNILSIKLLSKKSVDSDVFDDIVLDYDAEGNIVNIDLMNINLENLISHKTKISPRGNS